MENTKIEIELTQEQHAHLESLASIANRDTESYARDIVVIFLTQVCQPIVNLPKFNQDE